jgi:ABC-type polysaccharide/polyol phosphate transport system ATPase subunit
MDEWLSVGDADFKAKAAQRLEALVGNASIVVVASHEPALVERVCTRKISLEHGKIVADEPVVRADEAPGSQPASAVTRSAA